MLKRTESFHLKILPLVLLFAIPMVLSFLTFNNRGPPGYLTKKMRRKFRLEFPILSCGPINYTTGFT